MIFLKIAHSSGDVVMIPLVVIKEHYISAYIGANLCGARFTKL